MVRLVGQRCAGPVQRVLVLVGAAQSHSNLQRGLALAGCEVQVCSCDALSPVALAVSSFDVVLLDDISELDVARWCEGTRDLADRPALVVVTDQRKIEIRAFQTGADDCVSDERECAVIRRVMVNALRRQVLRESSPRQRTIFTASGTLAISLAPLVSLNGIPLELPRVQIRILRKLMESSRPVSVRELASSAWPKERVAVHTVHTQVALLRARLDEIDVKVKHIRREGYVLLS